MKIQTFSVVTGTAACNARCPFCVSKMTVSNGLGMKEPEVNIRNFRKAARLAQMCGTTTVMLTGKGEPTLFEEQVTQYLRELKPFDFPFTELQTNGVTIGDGTLKPLRLSQWFDYGLNTVAISICHYEDSFNREIYVPYKKEYPSLVNTIARLHECGFSVRLATVLIDGGIDTPEKVANLVKFAKDNKVEQLTIRPVNRTDDDVTESDSVHAWVGKHGLPEGAMQKINEYIVFNGKLLMRLQHGADVYDLDGQNLCTTNSLTLCADEAGDHIRQLIYFPDGHLYYDWQYKGAILL